MLLAALNPLAIEYLLNGMRFICGSSSAKSRPLPVGTAGNEALHSELKLWFENMSSYHEDRLALALRLFLLAKMLAFFAAAAFPFTAQMRQGAVLCRLMAKLRQRGTPLAVSGGMEGPSTMKRDTTKEMKQTAHDAKPRRKRRPPSTAGPSEEDRPLKRRHTVHSAPRRTRATFRRGRLPK